MLTKLLLAVALVAGCVSAQNTVEPTLEPTRAFDVEIETLLAGQGEAITALENNLGNMWLLVCGVIVFLMQLGFLLLEAGAIRSRNVSSIIYKNFVDSGIGAIMWWICGYGFAFAGDNVFIGGAQSKLFAMTPDPTGEFYGDLTFFFLSYTYMTTAATIVSGAVAERVNLVGYAVMVVFITGFSYPVAVHWIWSEYGWLSPFSGDNKIFANGVLDFAGSVVLHAFGGCCSIVFAFWLGPRKLPGGIDVFSEEGQKIVAPHNKVLQAAGTIILWFSWFAFNGGSVGDINGNGSLTVANALVTTLLSAAASTVTCMVFTRFYFGFFDIGHTLNASLAGLVGITSGCGYMAPVYSVITGIVSFFAYFGFHKLRIKLRIDDVVDAGAVHYAAGAWGGIATGLFCDGDRIREVTGIEGSVEYGLFLGGGGEQLGMQLLGVVMITAWCTLTTTAMFFVIKYTVGARLDEKIELEGIDVNEHGGHAFDYLSYSGWGAAPARVGVELIDLVIKMGQAIEASKDTSSAAADVREAMISLEKALLASSQPAGRVNEADTPVVAAESREPETA